MARDRFRKISETAIEVEKDIPEKVIPARIEKVQYEYKFLHPPESTCYRDLSTLNKFPNLLKQPRISIER